MKDLFSSAMEQLNGLIRTYAPKSQELAALLGNRRWILAKANLPIPVDD